MQGNIFKGTKNFFLAFDLLLKGLFCELNTEGSDSKRKIEILIENNASSNDS